MLETATVHREVLEETASACCLVYRSDRIWPLSNERYLRGIGRGVLTPQVGPNQSPSPLTVGVFECASRVYELVWKEYVRGSYLSAYIGKNGSNLRKAIVLAEVAHLQKRHGFSYRVYVGVDETITITIERCSHGEREDHYRDFTEGCSQD